MWLRGLHFLSKPALRLAGFRFETIQQGDIQLGVFKKKINLPFTTTEATKKLMIVPGFGDTPLSWLGIVAFLTPKLHKNYSEVLIVDYPGFLGFLAKHRAPDSVDLLRQMLATVIKHAKPTALMGHSLGGWLATDFVLTHKARYIEHLIVAAPSGVFPDEQERETWRDIFQRATIEGFNQIKEMLFLKKPALFNLTLQEYESWIKRDDIKTLLASFTREHELTDRIESLTTPLHIIWGDQDLLVPTHWNEAWRKCPSTRTVRILHNTGHNPQLERPGRLAQAVAECLH